MVSFVSVLPFCIFQDHRPFLLLLCIFFELCFFTVVPVINSHVCTLVICLLFDLCVCLLLFVALSFQAFSFVVGFTLFISLIASLLLFKFPFAFFIFILFLAKTISFFLNT